jgi:hypothetical protein
MLACHVWLPRGRIFSHRALPVGLDEMAIIAVRNTFEVVLMLHATTPKTWPRRSRLYASSHPETKSVELDVDIALEANGRADELVLVPPRAAADHTVAWIATLEPR